MSVIVGDDGVQVVDDPQAVAPQPQRVRVLAEQVLAGVEVADPVPERRRVAVRDDHLRDRRAVEDRERLAVGAESDLVQGEALARVEPDTHLPVLPADQGAVHGEAGAVGLADLDRLEARAGRSDRCPVEVPVRRRHGHVPAVLDAQDVARDHVDIGDQTFDGVRPGAVLDVVPEEGQPAQDPAPLFTRAVEEAGRQGRDEGEGRVGHPPAGQRSLPPRIGLDQVRAAVVLLEQHRRLPIGRLGGVDVDPRLDPIAVQIHQRFGERAAGCVDQCRFDPPRDGVSRFMSSDGVLRRLTQQHRGEPGAGCEAPRGVQHSTGSIDVGGRQRIEGVRDLDVLPRTRRGGGHGDSLEP